TIIQAQPQGQLRLEVARLKIQVQQVFGVVVDAEEPVGSTADYGADVAVLDGDAAAPAPGQGQPVGRRHVGQRLHCRIKRVFHAAASGRDTGYWGISAGSCTVNVDPLPISLATWTSPPIIWQNLRVMASPRPVPPNLRVVEASACTKG